MTIDAEAHHCDITRSETFAPGFHTHGMNSRAESSALAAPKPKATHRSRVTNGSALLPGVDGRSLWARRLRDIVELHATDLGGTDRLSHAELSLIRRAGTLTVELERLELQFAQADSTDAELLDLYARVAGNLRRILEPLGLKRVARDVKPTLDSYLDHSARPAP